MHAVSAGRWYAMSSGDVSGSGCMLAKHLKWENRSADEKGEPRPQIVRYCSEDFTFDQFTAIFRLITRAYVTPEEFLKCSAAIKFFGPFDYSQYLVEFDSQAPALEAPTTMTASSSCAACGACGAGVTIQRCSRCRDAFFCSEACFQKDYFRHRVACSAAVSEKGRAERRVSVERKYKKMRVGQLKDECKARQLPFRGVKDKESLVGLLVQTEVPPHHQPREARGAQPQPHPPKRSWTAT
mmetsp:Transcript_54451/g.133085  ORF Transcript_54451/g.133085 Transcript_54451/m.133085 type:complete len:240 (-) Transcript_54451:961-1680(-)